MTKFLLKGLLITMSCMALSGCGEKVADVLKAKAVDGQVFIAGTKQPVAGAIVVLEWEAVSIRPWNAFDGHSSGRDICYRVETTVTDAQGRYHIPAWQERQSHHIPNGDFRAVAYKRGYTQTRSAGSEDRYKLQYASESDREKNKLTPNIEMAVFTGTLDQRFEDLITMQIHCQFATYTEQNLLPIVKAIAEEMKQTAETDQQKISVSNFQRKSADLSKLLDGNLYPAAGN
jgi:hypothetical protein